MEDARGTHPNSLANLKPNDHILDLNPLKTGPKTKIGKFRTSLNAVRGNKTNKAADIPEEIRELYNWAKRFDTKQLNELIELKNIYFVMQQAQLPELIKKGLNHEPLSRKDVDALRLMADINVNSHKMKYGDKKVIEHKVTVDDIRNQMSSNKIIVDAEVIPNEAQDTDRSGRGTGEGTEDQESQGDNGSS